MRRFREEKETLCKEGMARASITVETSCMMSLVLLTLTGLLYLCFFVHNRTWLEAAAYEAALSGSMEGIKEDAKVLETAEGKGRELGNYGFFGGENLRMSVDAGKTVKVTYDLDTEARFGWNWKLHTEGTSEVIKPVKWVRRIKAASQVLEGVVNGE